MGGAGYQAGAWANGVSPRSSQGTGPSWPAAVAKVHPRAQCRGQPHISRYHQGKPPATANPGQVPPKPGTRGVRVMTQDHAGQSPRQPRHRGARIG